MRAGLELYAVPTDEDLQLNRVHLLTKGNAGQPLPPYGQLQAGHASWMERVRALQRDVAAGDLDLPYLSATESGDLVPCEPHPALNCYQLIELAIETRTATVEFIEAWGFLNMLVGRSVELDETERLAANQYNREIMSGAFTDNAARSRWYAHWTIAHIRNNESKRGACDFEIHSLCLRIWKGELDAGKYGEPWFRRMLVWGAKKPVPPFGKRKVNGKEVAEDAVHLSETFTRLDLSELVELANDPLIRAEHLPPLHARSYLPLRLKP